MANSFFSSLPPLWAVSDEQAMWRVKMENDPQAFAKLVGRGEKSIPRPCQRMTGDAHRAEDLAQEAFARLFARRKDYEPSGRFSTFLRRIALNLCYDELRKRKRRGESSLDDDPGSDGDARFVADEPAPDCRLMGRERAEAVQRALGQIAEPYRVVVVLRHYEGLKFREIGEVLDLPDGTVKSRMAEALHQLNRILNPLLQDRPNPGARTKESLLI